MKGDSDLRGGDVIDTWDLQARLEYLEDELDTARNVWDPEENDGEEWDEEFFEDIEELTEIRELKEEVTEWREGNGLIRDGYFEEYAQQLAEDIGAIKRNEGWPYDHIDWEAAAEELKGDYSSVEFGGETYWYRS